MKNLCSTRHSLPWLFFGMCISTAVDAQSPVDVLTLPEMLITSIRGVVTNEFNDASTKLEMPSSMAGQPPAPLRIAPGKRLYVGVRSHALFSFPGAGTCMVVGDNSSICLPVASEKGITLGFDAHPASNSKAFFNINAAEMARHGGAVFRIKTKDRGNSGQETGGYAKTFISTQGGRFFVNDYQLFEDVGRQPGGNKVGCTVGVFDGSVQVEELNSKQQTEVKPGTVVVVRPDGISQPRPMTRAEASYDIGCKLAALGKEVPARLPASMKTTPKSVMGSKVNSLGMLFVPVPGTKVLICVHETRGQDYAAYLAANPAARTDLYPERAKGFWGWEDHPAITSWDEAAAFCTWLSQKEGKTYRLPTDEEWSQAAGIARREVRKKDTTPKDLGQKSIELFSWGAKWPPPPNAENLADASQQADNPTTRLFDQLSQYDDGFVDTAPVMSFLPNKLGIYDLGGNVSEWCEDWYDDTRQGRVVRGADYQSGGQYYTNPPITDPSSMFLSSRISRQTSYKFDTGFRVVMVVP